MDDINKGAVIGRLTRDAEMAYTSSGTAYCKFAIALNKPRKVGERWTDEAHFFDFTLWGKRAEGLSQYLTKGQQVGIEYSLKQERWEQDGNKRSKVSFDIKNIQLIGSKRDSSQDANQEQPQPPQGGRDRSGEADIYTPPSQPVKDDYESEIPF